MTALFQRIALALVATTVCVVPDGARAQSVITAKASSAASGSAATAVISVDLPAGQQLATLQFNLTVTPVGTAPPLEQPAAFVNALAPPQIGPSLVLNEGNSIVLVGWLQEIAPALTGHVDLGTLTVPIPAGAQVDDRYRIEINRASGTADGRTAVALTAASDEFAVVPGLPACVGDCNDDRRVAVNELVLGVRIALNATGLGECPAFNANDDSSVTIAELVTGVRNALQGCPSDDQVTHGRERSCAAIGTRTNGDCDDR